MAELLIGLMSGTSMDAVDAVLVEFTDNNPYLVEKYSLPIPPSLRQQLQTLARPGVNELDCMACLDSALARLFAEAVITLLNQAGIPASRVRAIGNHGQTIRHSPAGSEPYTIQIGNPNLITELTGIMTVTDFRRRDMAAGGQGAPLAPAFHAAFFHHPGDTRVVVNIGGIANITLLPGESARPVSGFDTGPGNTLLDAWALQHRGVPMDSNGAWGRQGQAVSALLDCCLEDDYFIRSPPKSTGPEYFHLGWLQGKLANWGGRATPQDIQATLVELTGHSIARAIRQYAPATRRVLVCGGGVHNQGVLDSLRHQLSNITVESTATLGVDPDYLEAIGFAWLAKRTLDNLPGNLPEVTGARGPRILGGIYPA